MVKKSSEKILKEAAKKLDEEIRSQNRLLTEASSSIESLQSKKSDIKANVAKLTEQLEDINSDLGISG